MHVDRASIGRYLALKLHARAAATSQVQGNRRSPQRGRGVEFADYRAYDQGDDIRLVDWNVYLRLGIALVKQFTEERSLSLRVCLDVSESMAFGEPRKCDHAAQIAAALSMVALGQREPITLMCAGGEMPPTRIRAVNLDAMADIISMLEKLEPTGRGDLKAQLGAHLGQARSDVLVLMSDLLVEEEERDNILRLCAASSHHPALLHIVSQDELDLGESGRVIDSETQEEIVIPNGAREAYLKVVAAWLSSIEERCRRLGISYLRVPTDVAVDHVIMRGLHEKQLIEHRTGGAR